ncbi:MAG: thioredoxin [Clostridia bacterium]|nr:thioredoxin [Clostridia bacterium]
MAEIVLTKENFEDTVKTNDRVLVDFWATWCGPCRLIAPHVEAIAKEHPEITVGKVNVDDYPELAIKFNIVSIPTLLYFEKGKLIETIVGYHTKEDLEKKLF